MEKKYVCRCGKVFSCLQALGGHSRWCQDRRDDGDKEVERGKEADGAAGKDGDARETKDSSRTNQAKEGNGHDGSDGEESQTDTVIPESSWQFRCVSCFQMFPSADAYRLHYLSDHLGVKNGIKMEVDEGNDQIKESDTEQTGRKSFCKRCRIRILSSSEEDDDVNDAPVKKARKRIGGYGPAISPTPSPELTKSSDVSATSTKNVDPPIKNTSARISVEPTLGMNLSENQKIDPGTPVLPAAKPAGPDEIVVSLLKDANALSKMYKIVILNFFSGRRVNPDPAKGPVQVIRLGEKKEVVTDEDGTEKNVHRETFVKLNFETGDWEKIQKTRSIQSEASSSSG